MFARGWRRPARSFLPLEQHRVVAISACCARATSCRCGVSGRPRARRRSLRRFFGGLDKLRPTLVSWNGTGFDLPVLHYRMLRHGVAVADLLGQRRTRSRFQVEQLPEPLSRAPHRSHGRAVGVPGRGRASLEDMALLLRLPGKLGMAGDQVWPAFRAGRIGRDPRLLRNRRPEHLSRLPALRTDPRNARRPRTMKPKSAAFAAGSRSARRTTGAASLRHGTPLEAGSRRPKPPPSSRWITTAVASPGSAARQCSSRAHCPGRRVLLQRTRRRRRHDEAELLEVLRPSPDRVTPRCRHFGVCGGCSLQHLAHDAQLAAKGRIVADELARIGGVEPERWLPPLAGPAWAYRRRARLGCKFVDRKERVLVGFRERGSPLLADLHNVKSSPRRSAR